MEKPGLNDSASVAGDTESGDSPAKGSVIESKTFRDGLIYLYKRADFKKPTWLCRIKVPGTKGYINRSTKTGDEFQAFKFADDLYNQLHIKYLKGEAPIGKRIGPVIDAYIKRIEPHRERTYFRYKILLMKRVKPFLERQTFEELSTATLSQLVDHLTTITKKGQLSPNTVKRIPSAVQLCWSDEGQTVYDLDNPLLNIITHVRVAQWASQNNLRSLFKKLREENGWEIVTVETPEKQTGEDKWDEAEEKVYQERIERVLAARILTHEEYLELSKLKRGGKRMKLVDRDALERAEIERLWQAPATANRVGYYSRGAVITKIEAYLRVFSRYNHASSHSIHEMEETHSKGKPMLKAGPENLALRMLISVGLVKHGELQPQRRVDKTDFAPFIELCHNNRVIIQEVFGTSLRKDLKNNPIRQFSEFIGCIGLDLIDSGRRRVNGKTLQTYKIDHNSLKNINEMSEIYSKNKDKLFPWKYKQI